MQKLNNKLEAVRPLKSEVVGSRRDSEHEEGTLE